MFTQSRSLRLRILEAAGGLSQLARLIGIERESLRGWQRVPGARVLRVEALTGISRHELRPDLYPPDLDYMPPLTERERRAVLAVRRAEAAELAGVRPAQIASASVAAIKKTLAPARPERKMNGHAEAKPAPSKPAKAAGRQTVNGAGKPKRVRDAGLAAPARR